MPTAADIKQEMDRAARNVTGLTNALRKERQDRAEDNKKKDEEIRKLNGLVLELEGKLTTTTSAMEKHVQAVADGASGLAGANEEAEGILREESRLPF